MNIKPKKEPRDKKVKNHVQGLTEEQCEHYLITEKSARNQEKTIKKERGDRSSPQA